MRAFGIAWSVGLALTFPIIGVSDDRVVGEWSQPVKGLRCRVMLPRCVYQKGELITVHVEFENLSEQAVQLLDFVE